MTNRLRFPILLVLGLTAGSSSKAQPELGGFVEYDNITYPETEERDKINGRNQVILQTELRHEASSKANIFGALEFRYDEADEARNRVYLDEAYVDVYAGPVDLRIGKQIYSWGRADGFNPTDFSAWDFSDFLDTDDERLGLVSGRATYYVGSWFAEGILAPAFTPSVLPEMDSRWWPELPAFVQNPAYPQSGPPLLNAKYSFAGEILPDEGLESTQYALKVTGFFGGWDFSISWFDGFDDLPALHLDVEVDSASTGALTEVTPQYHRRRTIGADLASVLGAVGLHGETAYYLTEDWSGTDPAIDDPYVHFVVGADYTIDDVFSFNDLFVLVEWSREIQIPDRGTVYRFTDLNHVFRQSVFLKADLDLSDFSLVSLAAVYNFETKDWYAQPSMSWSIADGLELELDVDLLGGPDDSFYGSFGANRRLHTRLKYSF